MSKNSSLYSFLKLTDNVSDEILLKKIHFKRLKFKFSINCINEIENKFILTNDIRFFNELLWICKDQKKISASFRKFKDNIINGNYNHNYNLSNGDLDYNQIKINKINFGNDSIALIGNPIFFIVPYFKLLKYGKRADIIHINYHPNKSLNKIFNGLSFLYKFIFKSSYIKIKIDNKSELSKIKLSQKYDIGFHKLNFIIKENIISCFRKGLINDHWGRLPFLKGRSTLLYSMLFDLPPTITTHLIEREIDSGKIINYYPLNKKFLKFQIIFGLSKRIFESLNLLSQMKFKEINNKTGYVFYEMHPTLIKMLNKS